MKKILIKLLNIFVNILKIDDKKIIFEAGRGIVDGNVKAVYDYIVENNIKDFKTIWFVEKGTDVSSLREGDYIYYGTLRKYYHLATAKYWIRSQSLGGLIKKRKGQIYIQLFHGNGPMKKMGYDVTNAKERPPIDHVKEWDYYIGHSEEDINIIKSSTGYNNKCEILGMACIDSTLKLVKDNERKKQILEKLGILEKSKNKKIIFYAPTFRDFDLDKDVIDVPIEELATLKDYIVIVRFHPLVRKKVNLDLFKHDNIVNGCDYPDSADILSITDILITDYSNIYMQYLPLELPIIFYPYDYEAYVELRGGFYLDYKKEVPGVICYTEEELINTIKNISNLSKEIKKKQKVFNKKHNYLADGNASKRLVDKIIEGYFK